MSDDKKMPTDFCNQTTEADDVKIQDPNSGRRWARKRRLMIVSLVFTVLLLCILTAVIVFISLWTTRVLFQEKKHLVIGNKQVDLELYQDTDDSITYYHITDDNNVEMWVIFDYNRELEIMKVKKSDIASSCYVSPQDSSKIKQKNTTVTNSTDGIVNAGNKTQSNDSLPVVLLRPSNRPIREKSILGKRGQELCQGIDTFWILSSCDQSAGDSSAAGDVRGSRVRRTTYTYTYESCYPDWSNCHNIIFADTYYITYYGCDYVCGWQTVTWTY